ncbi:DUF2934 domain-containing protein [Bryobacter aggregatus]|uniref:DUF2934 domain-containing protein n=1 Tax=Bryobacter aggregatus TaxID=360054 RepID=UPI0009B5A494|nr:DUF2934 domain-containing protein [Bryobacter aggregatus]
MSIHQKNPPNGHRRAAELHDAAAHAHRVAEQHGKQDHITGQEQTRNALEHTQKAHRQSQILAAAHGIIPFGHQEIATLAYERWQSRGCPNGTALEDWYAASEQLRAGNSRLLRA